jgi:O-antigen/teichoic acid export membrane protein
MSAKGDRRNEGAKFSASTFKTFFMLVLGQIFSLAISVLTARTLGPAGKGIAAVVLLYPTLLFTLGHLSIYRAILSHVGEARYSMRDFCGTVGFFAFAVSIFLIGGFWCVYSWYPEFFIRSVSPGLILLGLSALPFFLINQFYASIIQTQDKIAQVNLIMFIQPFATCLVLFVVWALAGLTITRVVACYVVANIVAAGLALWLCARLFPGGWLIRWGLLRAVVADGLKLHAGVISIYLFLKIDQLMLSHYRGDSSLGFYTISVSYSELLLLVPTAIQTVFYAKVTGLLKDKADIVPMTLFSYRHNLLALLLLSAVLSLGVYPFIILFYGRDFLPALRPFLVLLPGAFFLYWNNVLANYMVSTRRFWTISMISGATAFLNIVLNMIFIPRWDATGAACASSLAYVLAGAAYIGAFLKFSGLAPGDFWCNLRLSRDDFSLYRDYIRSLWLRNR